MIVIIFGCGLHQGLGLPDFRFRVEQQARIVAQHHATKATGKLVLIVALAIGRKREAHASSVVFHSRYTMVVSSAAAAARKVAPIGMDKSVLLTLLVHVQISEATLVGSMVLDFHLRATVISPVLLKLQILFNNHRTPPHFDYSLTKRIE